jgi:hypothetical protein
MSFVAFQIMFVTLFGPILESLIPHRVICVIWCFVTPIPASGKKHLFIEISMLRLKPVYVVALRLGDCPDDPNAHLLK